MANCFGDVVDDKRLEQMEKYRGKPKTQEDRAREAMHLIEENDKKINAEDYVNQVKDRYGYGQSTRVLIYNATGEPLHLVTDHDWWGHISQTPYPREIGNGQWAAFLHVHKSGAAEGSVAAVVYRGKNKDGQDRDFLVSWSTPWSYFYKNKFYCTAAVVGYFTGHWDKVYRTLTNDAGYHSKADCEGSLLEGEIGTGDSPLAECKIKIPYSE